MLEHGNHQSLLAVRGAYLLHYHVRVESHDLCQITCAMNHTECVGDVTHELTKDQTGNQNWQDTNLWETYSWLVKKDTALHVTESHGFRCIGKEKGLFRALLRNPLKRTHLLSLSESLFATRFSLPWWHVTIAVTINFDRSGHKQVWAGNTRHVWIWSR